MKFFLTPLLLALLVPLSTLAQQTINPEVLAPKSNDTALQQLLTSPGKQSSLATISTRAQQALHKAYQGITGESWEKTRSGYQAKFWLNETRHIVYYTKNGRWAGSLKGYTAGQLATDIKRLVNCSYPGYNISYVQEAETALSTGKPTYIIHLENSERLLYLRVFEGEAEVWNVYKKASSK